LFAHVIFYRSPKGSRNQW